MLTPTFSYVST